MEVIEGQVEDLDRSSQVSGTENGTSTTHIAIFKIGENRVLLSSLQPPMIANGDLVKIAGIEKPGKFNAIACKNLTTGWTSTFNKQGCTLFFLVFITLVFLLLSLFAFPFILVSCFFGFFAFMITSRNSKLNKAHRLIED